MINERVERGKEISNRANSRRALTSCRCLGQAGEVTGPTHTHLSPVGRVPSRGVSLRQPTTCGCIGIHAAWDAQCPVAAMPQFPFALIPPRDRIQSCPCSIRISHWLPWRWPSPSIHAPANRSNESKKANSAPWRTAHVSVSSRCATRKECRRS